MRLPRHSIATASGLSRTGASCCRNVWGNTSLLPARRHSLRTPRRKRSLLRRPHTPTKRACSSVTFPLQKDRAFMEIAGEWQLHEDGQSRPMIHGTVVGADGSRQGDDFIIDTGADQTV